MLYTYKTYLYNVYKYVSYINILFIYFSVRKIELKSSFIRGGIYIFVLFLFVPTFMKHYCTCILVKRADKAIPVKIITDLI